VLCLCSVAGHSQAVLQIEQEPVCWLTPAGADSSLTRYVLFSSRTPTAPVVLAYVNASGTVVNPTGGSFSPGWCGCCGDGGGGDNDWYFINENAITAPVWRSGRVLIGTPDDLPADTAHQLQLEGDWQFLPDAFGSRFDWQDTADTTGTSWYGILFSAPAGLGGSSNLSGSRNTLTLATSNTVIDRTRLGVLAFAGNNPSDTDHALGAFLEAVAEGDWSPTSLGTALNVWTTLPGETFPRNTFTFQGDGRLEMDRYFLFSDGVPTALLGYNSTTRDATRHPIAGTPAPGSVIVVDGTGTGLEWQLLNADLIPFDTSGTILTATNVQDAIEEIISLIPGATVGQNVLYVSEGIGDNNTAIVGSYLFPFKHPWAARDTAIAKGILSPVILIFDGNFKWYQGPSGVCTDCDFSGNSQPAISLIRNNFTYLSLPGVVFNYGGGTLTSDINALFSDSLGHTCNFLGSADFVMQLGPKLCWLQHPNARFTFQANKITNTSSGGTMFQARKTAATLSAGGGFKELNVSVKSLANTACAYVFFALWGQSPFTDTLRADAVQINIEQANMLNSNGLFRVDPIYAIIPAVNVYVGNAVYAANIGCGFELFVVGRTGWINSRLNFVVNQLTITSTQVSQYIYGWTAGKAWTNTDQIVKINAIVGQWAFFSGISTVSGGTGNRFFIDINGVSTYPSAAVYNFGAGGNTGYDFYISGNLHTSIPFTAISKATGRLFFNNFNGVSSGGMLSSTVSRTDSVYFYNSSFIANSVATLTGNFPLVTSSSTFSPSWPGLNNRVIYSLGERPNLAFSGSGPYSLTAVGGNPVTFTEGTGISFSATPSNLTISEAPYTTDTVALTGGWVNVSGLELTARKQSSRVTMQGVIRGVNIPFPGLVNVTTTLPTDYRLTLGGFSAMCVDNGTLRPVLVQMITGTITVQSGDGASINLNDDPSDALIFQNTYYKN